MFTRKQLNRKYEILNDAVIVIAKPAFTGRVSEISDASIIEEMISRGSSLVRRKAKPERKPAPQAHDDNT